MNGFIFPVPLSFFGGCPTARHDPVPRLDLVVLSAVGPPTTTTEVDFNDSTLLANITWMLHEQDWPSIDTSLVQTYRRRR
jgi:hypothetical protein